MEKIETTEYVCDYCKTTFYADYGVVECCPKCGSTSEFDTVRNLVLIVEKYWKT